VYGLDRQHWGDEIKTANVSSGSAAGLRKLDLDAIDLPVKQTCHTANDGVRHVRPIAAGGDRQQCRSPVAE
jgi:hypothetical protein